MVVPAKPILDFNMRFHAGDDVTIPIRELAGAENADEERRAKQ
jgi:hypothetical protein